MVTPKPGRSILGNARLQSSQSMPRNRPVSWSWSATSGLSATTPSGLSYQRLTDSPRHISHLSPLSNARAVNSAQVNGRPSLPKIPCLRQSLSRCCGVLIIRSPFFSRQLSCAARRPTVHGGGEFPAVHSCSPDAVQEGHGVGTATGSGIQPKALVSMYSASVASMGANSPTSTAP